MTDDALEIRIGGTVQGVGFRPFVYRLAAEHGVSGTVGNTAGGVVIRARAEAAALQAFVRALRENPPPLAAIATFAAVPFSPDQISGPGFRIVASALGEVPAVDVVRDTCVCAACLREMRDPGNRRYRHPFINCTDCGPRYTIIRALPYDRPNTTMADFPMCPDCRREYEDPADRRFHAQPVCCPNCGPSLGYLHGDGSRAQVSDPLLAGIDCLVRGKILAVKGLGGFHLACRADDAAAVARLRRRKHREEKPFAVMVKDLATARGLCAPTAAEEALLCSIERPIVLLPRAPGGRRLPEAIAPGVETLGLLLPYTPLHELLFDTPEYDALVMTSANRSGDPICADNDEAVRRLGGIADAFLVHDRPIRMRADDSVMRLAAGEPLTIRRARGRVPSPLTVGEPAGGIVGLGGILKTTVAVGRGSSCYTSHYLGAAEDAATMDLCDDVLDHYLRLLGVTPRLAVRDLHPGGYGAQCRALPRGLPALRVQHHHAHAAACLAENGIAGPAVCIVYDGVGLGDDGTGWGAEFLVADRAGYRRAGTWAAMRMPGGDAATRHPPRMALGALYDLMGAEAADRIPGLEEDERDALLSMLAVDVNCPRTHSMGRLFDAAAALLGLCRVRTYEGQPAIVLEGAARGEPADPYRVAIAERGGLAVADGPGLLARVLADRDRGTPAEHVAARFHAAVADATVAMARTIAARESIGTVCLSGGCFLNARLLERTAASLACAGMRVARHRVLPPGDECISFGQVVIGAARLARGEPAPSAPGLA